uniref:Uncharacterized protein n=1 Tax=Cacopsylla melanoneura TaxID=428564 RepID=A0A8D8T9F4_9HEMI
MEIEVDHCFLGMSNCFLFITGSWFSKIIWRRKQDVPSKLTFIFTGQMGLCRPQYLVIHFDGFQIPALPCSCALLSYCPSSFQFHPHNVPDTALPCSCYFLFIYF